MVKGVRQSGVDTAGASMSSPLVTITNYAPFPENLHADLDRRSRRPQLPHPHRPRPAGSGRSDRASSGAEAGGHRDQHHRGPALSGAANPQPGVGRGQRAAHRSAGWGSVQGLGDAQSDVRRLAATPRRAQDHADCTGRRRDRRLDRLCRRQLPARRALHPGAHHPAGAGGFLGGRQDRHQPSPGQEHDRRVLPAETGAGRHRHAQDPAAARTVGRPGGSHQVRPDPGRGFLCLAGSQHGEAPRARAAGHCPRHLPLMRDQGPGGGAGRARIRCARAAQSGPHFWPCHRGRHGLRQLAAWRGGGRGHGDGRARVPRHGLDQSERPDPSRVPDRAGRAAG